MILTRRKISQPKTLKNGIWDVIIQSVYESKVDGKNVLIFNLKNDSGQINMTLPVNDKIRTKLDPLMFLAGITEYTGLGCFVGREIRIEIKNNKVKNITRPSY